MHCSEVSCKDGVSEKGKGAHDKMSFYNSNPAGFIWKESCYVWHDARRETSMKYSVKMTNPTNMPWNDRSTEHKALPEVFISLVCFETTDSKRHNCFGGFRYLNRQNQQLILVALKRSELHTN